MSETQASSGWPWRMSLRRRLKRTIQRQIVGGGPLICASLGRSGSTMLTDALVSGLAKARLPFASAIAERAIYDWLWRLDEDYTVPGAIYKTHDLPFRITGNKDLRAIFIFGSAAEAAISTYSCRQRFGDDWMQTHLAHLNATFDSKQPFETDTLRFADQISAWTNFTRIPVLCLRFERLWENVEAIEDFVGYSICLPARRQRNSTFIVTDEIRRRATRLYRELDGVIEALPNAFIAGTQNGDYTVAHCRKISGRDPDQSAGMMHHSNDASP